MSFGVFDMSTLRSDECNFAPGIVCESYILGGEVGDALAFELLNVYGVDLELIDIELRNPILGEDVTCELFGGGAVNSYVWEYENSTTFACDLAGVEGYPAPDKYEMQLLMNFTQVGNSYEHFTRGIIFTAAQ